MSNLTKKSTKPRRSAGSDAGSGRGARAGSRLPRPRREARAAPADEEVALALRRSRSRAARCVRVAPAARAAAPPRRATPIASRSSRPSAARSGARLVAIDEHGDRQFELLAAGRRDRRATPHPAMSPDGKWIVFASSRERALDETSLWIAPLAPERDAARGSRPATRSTAIRRGRRDGRAIVFASTRDGGDFDLCRLAIDRRPRGRRARAADARRRATRSRRRSRATARSSTPRSRRSRRPGREPPRGARARRHDRAAHRRARPTRRRRCRPTARRSRSRGPVEHDGALDAELWTMPRGGGTATPARRSAAHRRERPGVVARRPLRVRDVACCAARRATPVFSSVIAIDLTRAPTRRAHPRGSRRRDRAAHSRDRARAARCDRARTPIQSTFPSWRASSPRAIAEQKPTEPMSRLALAASSSSLVACSSPPRRRIQRRRDRAAVARRRRADDRDPGGPVHRRLDARGARRRVRRLSRRPRATTPRARSSGSTARKIATSRELPAFRIDLMPVTQAEYAEFVDREAARRRRTIDEAGVEGAGLRAGLRDPGRALRLARRSRRRRAARIIRSCS